MVNQHQALKLAHKVGTARTDEGQTFKKPFQTVGRPPTVNHNMHEDFMRNPPKNLPQEVGRRSDFKWGQKKEDSHGGVWGQEEIGRIKPSDIQTELMEEGSVHS